MLRQQSPKGTRGGSTVGAPVELARDASAAFKALQAPGISPQERDRRAILAMAGCYKVSFEFRELVSFVPELALDQPYRSWATECVFILDDRPEHVSLQHIMQMHFIMEGKEVGPMVMKHWRQDWDYAPQELLRFAGHGQWERRGVEGAGHWSQQVYQVDDSPRYGGIGRWVHHANFSEWLSERSWRPLPRREYSVRNDYDALVGINHHLILPTGWVHLQRNRKARTRDGNIETLLAEEIGLNRYQRLAAFDARPAEDYWRAHAPYWALVRSHWASIIAKHPRFALRDHVDGKALYERHFAYDADFNAASSRDAARQHVAETLDAYLIWPKR